MSEMNSPPSTSRSTWVEASTWPVLVGEDGEKRRMLSAPIILYDYPRIAPESPGDYFDGTEIDEMLALRIKTLTDEEKREMETHGAGGRRSSRSMDGEAPMGHERARTLVAGTSSTAMMRSASRSFEASAGRCSRRALPSGTSGSGVTTSPSR
jgi:hypothetical protein